MLWSGVRMATGKIAKSVFCRQKVSLDSGLLFKASLCLAVMVGPLTPAFLDQWMMRKITGR